MRRWYRLHTPDAYINILDITLALPYLPSELVPDGINYINTLIDNQGNIHSLQSFRLYLNRFWLPLANIISVFNNSIRTNNICELFHRAALRQMNSHLPFWRFLGMNILIARLD